MIFRAVSGAQEGANSWLEEAFIPKSLVQLVLKISNLYQIAHTDEFSLLDTLQTNLVIKSLAAQEMTKRKMCLLIINIIRICEKTNRAQSLLTKRKLESIFPVLGLESSDFNDNEFEVFKSMNFKTQSPVLLEMVYELIGKFPALKTKKALFELSLDILRHVYLNRSEIYEVCCENKGDDVARKLRKNLNLLASAVIIVMLKVLNVPDRSFNQTFETMIRKEGDQFSASDLNQLSAVIFDFIKNSLNYS